MSVNGQPIEAVLLRSEPMPEGTPVVKGYDFNQGFDFDAFIKSFYTTGFQATNLGLAIEEVNKMLRWDFSQVPADPEDEFQTPEERSQIKCTIFLGYTSNMISSGVREIIRFLAQHKMVSCIVTTAGGIEEDFIKCRADTYIGAFDLPGEELRKKGHNRIGNLLIPNDNYCFFEDWLNPILDSMLQEQMKEGKIWSPSLIIDRLGQEINNEESVYYWCHKNGIPVFCPALTDGSLGDMIYFHSYGKEETKLIVDIASDIVRLNDMAIKAKRSGILILGGGVVKHHICNANLMRNGADFSVFINTGQEFDGSDSGARPDEAVSWGKIRRDAHAVKVYGEATTIFPLVVAATFAKEVYARQKKEQQ